MQESILSPKICPNAFNKVKLCKLILSFFFFFFTATVAAFAALPTFPPEKGITPQHEEDALSEMDLLSCRKPAVFTAPPGYH